MIMNHSNLVVKAQQQQFIYHHFKLICSFFLSFFLAKYEKAEIFCSCDVNIQQHISKY